MDKPDFLKSPAASAAPKDPFANRPQKQGSISEEYGDDNGVIPHFENRPQKQANPTPCVSPAPSGGKTPFGGPPYQPRLPYKLGK